jgi:hypothetical protein
MVGHLVVKRVITVAPDRKSAKCRGHGFSLGGIFGFPQNTPSQVGN